MQTRKLCLGIDFGTDSVRCAIIDATNGEVVSSHVDHYRRWATQEFCHAPSNQFRQHPLDHLESLENAVVGAITEGSVSSRDILAICVDTTGSSPLALNAEGVPLAMLPEFEANPNAMMILWKDHTAIAEADEINRVARRYELDYTIYSGGSYSSEWFWAKILHIGRKDTYVRDASYTWLEHCDWMTMELTGNKDFSNFKGSRCAAGHKAMWHESWDGFPSDDFFHELDPYLVQVKSNLFQTTHTSEQIAGHLNEYWANKLGLQTGIPVCVGLLDAHAEAIGAGVAEGVLVKVMGTSTCDMTIATNNSILDKPISGICGQVNGSIIPGSIGIEAGQSAFGDLLKWFNELVLWPVKHTLSAVKWMEPDQIERLQKELVDLTFIHLEKHAERIDPKESLPVAVDWINGRRTPDTNYSLRAAIMGLSLGNTAPYIYRALIEAMCFGAKEIVERLKDEGVRIDTVLGVGGISKKSPFIMQTLANVLNMPIKIRDSDHTAALGSAILASIAAGLYPDTLAAQERMLKPIVKIYYPEDEMVKYYKNRHGDYLRLGLFVENMK